MSTSIAESLFGSLRTKKDLDNYIASGQMEDQWSEAKVIIGKFDTDKWKNCLAKEISGFKNSSGGVIIWGANTTKIDGLGDVLTHPVPINNPRACVIEMQKCAKSITVPVALDIQYHIIKEGSGNAGYVITYIPSSKSDPTMDAITNKFWMRLGDVNREMPWELIKRQFTTSSGPDLDLDLEIESSTRTDTERYMEIGVTLVNRSICCAEKGIVFISTGDERIKIDSHQFRDYSKYNDVKWVLSKDFKEIYKGTNIQIGSIIIDSSDIPEAIFNIDLVVSLHSNMMEPVEKAYQIQVKNDTDVKITENTY